MNYYDVYIIEMGNFKSKDTKILRIYKDFAKCKKSINVSPQTGEIFIDGIRWHISPTSEYDIIEDLENIQIILDDYYMSRGYHISVEHINELLFELRMTNPEGKNACYTFMFLSPYKLARIRKLVEIEFADVKSPLSILRKNYVNDIREFENIPDCQTYIQQYFIDTSINHSPTIKFT